MRPSLVTGACLAVAALAVFAAVNSYQTSSAYAGQYPDAYGAASAEKRFAPVNAQIPAHCILGYITDIDPSHAGFAPAFLAAQFALAPRQVVLLKRQNPPEWAVGNFSKPVDYAAAGAVFGYQVVRDEGNGVILFRRKAS